MLEVARPRGRATTASCRPCSGVVARRSARARSSRSPASTATARASWSRRSPGCARVDSRRRSSSTGSDITGRRRARRARAGRRATSPRTATGAASCSTSRWPRTSRCASTTRPRSSQRGLALARSACASARSGLLKEYDVRGGGRDLARGVAVGRQPAEGRDRARDRVRTRSVLIAAQPTRGLDVGAIEFVHRRLVAERDAGRGDPARLARVRGGPLAGRPDPRHLRGRDRGRVPARRRPRRSSASR